MNDISGGYGGGCGGGCGGCGGGCCGRGYGNDIETLSGGKYSSKLKYSLGSLP